MSSWPARYFPRAYGEISPSEAKRVEYFQPVTNGDSCRDVLAASSDEALMSLVRQGDKEALGLLFQRYAGLVRGIAYRVLRDRSEADDLLQDVFLLIHRLCANFDHSKGSARVWILQMTYRRALCRRQYLTTRHFYKRLDVDEMANELTDPRTDIGPLDNTIEEIFGAGKEEQAFAALSENQRQTLRLYFVEGYTLEEIAHKMGQSKGNIKHHYVRGLGKLRQELLGSKLQQGSAI